MATVDITKKSNIKCEHCEQYRADCCLKTGDKKHYWNRCKEFEWKAKYVKKG